MRGRRYFADADLPDDGLKDAVDLITSCQEQRPDIWKAMSAAIINGLLRRKIRQSDPDSSATDSMGSMGLWSLESAENRERFIEDTVAAQAVVTGPGANIVITLLAGGGAIWLAREFELTPVAWVSAVCIFSILLRLPMDMVHASFPKYTVDPSTLTTAARWTGLFSGTAILTLMIVIGTWAVLAADTRQLVWAAVLGIGGLSLAGIRKLRQGAGSAITRRVRTGAAQPATVPPLAAAREGVVDETAASQPNPAFTSSSEPPQFTFRKLRLDAANLKSASDKAQKRVAAIRARGLSSRQLYQRAIGGMLVASGIALSAPPLLEGLEPNSGVLAAIAFSLLLLNARFARWMRLALLAIVARMSTGSSVEIESDSSDVEITSIRATGLQILGWLWVGVLITLGPEKNPAQPMTYLVTLIVLSYLVVTIVLRRRLEKQYPYEPALNLLALRVFNSPSFNDFLDFTSNWQHLGTRQRLDGPMTAGQKTEDLLNYVTGHIERSIISDPADAERAIAAFRFQPDRSLRFPVNSMQCSNETWQDVFERLLDGSDVVVMDSSVFTKDRAGSAYEISRLMQRIELSRVVFLISDHTDEQALDDVLEQSCKATNPDSVNRQDGPPLVTLLHIGWLSERNPDESIGIWRQRQRAKQRINSNDLIALLYDRATPRSSEPARVPKWAIRWARVPLPTLLRGLFQIVVGIVLLVWILS